ncbi:MULTISPECIES: teichoic acid D-Ala incorporation-associated protein DltX [Bacillaceae]|nr:MULTISPECIES: teichoic acid D-Ala incorporation-associated protein DltX [Bacillaceae]PET47989.1 teichoic acid D-Ala incorporation-associated protein DltX [Bacillus sp. AFS001701]PFH85851.1 teichoic acid D-Ala incorporation-associated protein DltX [Bacillus sp. AFS088145]PGM56598.1 teichoic acid D-Ala incorporation-associated protein DltX [Bacillus sp. AFS053548]
MGKIHIFRSKTLRFLFYTAFYLSILLALLYLYGFKDSFTGTFIYNDF